MTETGEPLTRACELVGRFFYHFGRVELQLDEAITRLFKLDNKNALNLTANIDFIRKAYIVHTALGLQAEAGKPVSVDVKKTFSAIRGLTDDRNTVAHS